MVILPGKKRVNDETIRQHADACGIKFIELQHENGFGGGPIPVNGFQHIEISVTENKGRKTFQQRPSKDLDNNDCNGNRSLVFEPDGVTGELLAWLPDTPFNRKKLAHCYHHGAQWTIKDVKIDADIRAMADEIEKTLAPKVSDEDVIVDMAGQLNDRDEEIAALKAQLALKTKADAVVTEKTEKDDREEWKKYGITQSKYANIKALARQEVYKENEEIMARLKKDSPKGWFGSSEYSEKVLPLVKQRLKDKLDALNVTGSNAAHK
jgi:hypothetical protein